MLDATAPHFTWMDNHTGGPMKLLTLLAAAVFCASCAPGPVVDGRLVAFSVDLQRRYGPTEVRVMHSASSDWLTLTMKDRRFRSSRAAALDSANAIAKFTASRLPADFRPDSIKVNVVVKSLNLGIYRTWETVMQTYPIAELQ
jgi:hypothetical protein